MKPSLKILIIEDKINELANLAEFFSYKGWEVIIANNGKEGLDKLAENNWTVDCILLDLLMPVMGGIEFLKRIGEFNNNIPIIVFSAELNKFEADDLYKGSVILVVEKGIQNSYVEGLAKNVCIRLGKKIETNFTENFSSIHSIDTKTRRREDILSSYYNKKISDKSNNLYSNLDEHLFVIARRWNSWYPSFFDVPGGCYSVISQCCEESHRNRVFVIDPGFRFLTALSELSISVRDIESCIISHNHPDHLGGAFEFIACRHAAKEKTKFICNPSSFSLFNSYNQDGVEIKELNNRLSLIECKKHIEKKCKILIDCFNTNHLEIGSKSDSKAIILEFSMYDPPRKVVILGDTSFEPSHNRKQFIDQLTQPQTKIIVLHIGSSQLKERINGHLYLQGLHRLIVAIGEELESQQRSKRDKLIVLISEWGLEHATHKQIEKICPDIPKFDDSSPIADTIAILNKILSDLQYDERMVVLPADIGLMVGIGSGKVYWQDNNTLKSEVAEKIKWEISDVGINYFH